MLKKIGVILFLSLLIIPSILAYTTIITVQTRPGQEVSLKFLHAYGPDKGRVISSTTSSFLKTSYSDGMVNFTYNTDSTESPLQISLIATPVMLTTRFFPNILLDKRVFINLTDENSEAVITNLVAAPADVATPALVQATNASQVQASPLAETNSTENSSAQANALTTTAQATPTPEKVAASTVVNPEKNSQAPITGNAIFGAGGIPKIWGYVLVGVLGFVLIGLFIFLMIVRKGKNQAASPISDIKTVKFSEKFGSSSDFSKNKDLAMAERKLQEARDEINKIKLKEVAVREAEAKLREDQERLKRLRGY